MGLFKDYVARGIYYTGIGVTDYAAWSKQMLDYCGSAIKPYIRDIRKWSIVIENSLDINKVTKLNCWQFMGCRLQKKGSLFRAKKEACICPVLSERRFDGVHGGINGGRTCWIVSHTLCGGTIQGTYEEKYETCLVCDFYHSVMEEEDELMNPYALKAMLL